MSTKAPPGAGDTAPPPPDFEPVPLRYRRDGWTPERQVGFIRALSECGCVAEACRRVGMSPESAYELARRPDAQSFRIAWDSAMDQAVRRLADSAFGRALNGVEVPHYYKGELVGTHRRFDERLTMFILRTRDPLRFGRQLESGEAAGSREGGALAFADALAWVRSDARREEAGLPRTVVAPPAANDDDDGEEPGLGHVYDFAPPPPELDDDADEASEDQAAELAREDGVEEQSDEEEERAALEDERAWAAVCEAALARHGVPDAEIDAILAWARRGPAGNPSPLAGEGTRARSGREGEGATYDDGRGSGPPPPDVPRTSSTSADDASAVERRE